MSSEWSIESIVAKATAATGILPEDMVLKFGGRQLKEGKNLTSYGVQHGSEIQIQAKAGRSVETTEGGSAKTAQGQGGEANDLMARRRSLLVSGRMNWTLAGTD